MEHARTMMRDTQRTWLGLPDGVAPYQIELRCQECANTVLVGRDMAERGSYYCDGSPIPYFERVRRTEAGYEHGVSLRDVIEAMEELQDVFGEMVLDVLRIRLGLPDDHEWPGEETEELEEGRGKMLHFHPRQAGADWIDMDRDRDTQILPPLDDQGAYEVGLVDKTVQENVQED